MRNIKYTTDGRKVVVIGNLNSQEKIVQEIFIVDGAEIPSGEQFVVKSLHDAPAVSWKEKNLKDLELRYDKESREWDIKLNQLRNKYRTQCDLFKEKSDYIGKALKEADESSFETLVNFICGKIAYVIVEEYGKPTLLHIDNFNQQYENKLRLISIFGQDDGSFKYHVGRYSDYSGGSTVFHPFASYEEALTMMYQLLLASGVSADNLKTAQEIGFEYPAEMIDQWKQAQIASYKRQVEQAEANLSKIKEQITKVEQI